MVRIDESFYEDLHFIDSHVHRFHPNRSGAFCTVAGGFIQGPNQMEHARETILYGMVAEELRRWFGMPEDASFLEIEEERNRRYLKDPFGYSKELLGNQKVDLYCLEIGSPLGGPRYSSRERAEFHTVLPEERCAAVVRIDRTLEELLPNCPCFQELVSDFHKSLREEIALEKTVGLKSCSSYYGGLSIGLWSKAEVEKAWDDYRKDIGNRMARKILNDFFVMESVEESVELQLPIQFHTGAGGGPFLDFRTQNPVNMIEFLKDPRVRNRATIVLLHGGHPYEEETGYLASQFSNVYTDFSGTFYLCSAKAPERMVALMEKCPLDKITYGSDGVGIPEISWFAYLQFKRQLKRVMETLMEGGYMTARRAMEVAGMIASGNAMACYPGIRKYLGKDK